MKIKNSISIASTLFFAFAFSALAYSQQSSAEDCAVGWETSFEAAKLRAQKEGKPILSLQLFGRLDEAMP